MSDDEYEVGYKRPPKSGQFKPGQSGNPNGRPKGKPTFQETMEKLFRQKIRVRKNGATVEVSRLEALGHRILDDALKGDPRATKQAIKMLGMGSSSDTAHAQRDGTEPDEASDLEALREFLRQSDLDPDLLCGGPIDDEIA